MKLSKNFKREEFACNCGCGFDTVDYELIQVLEDLRRTFQSPVIINSGCRCKKYNGAIGGAKNSQHTKGRAADIMIPDVAAVHVADFLENRYPDKFGIGRYDAFTHIDTRTNGPARWDYRT